MKALAWVAFIAALIPIQSVLLPHVSLWGIKPDIGLIAVCLAGLLGGELHGLLVGIAIGCAMSLFSAEDPATSMLAKGAVGYLTGVAGRHIMYLSPLVFALGIMATSCLAGLLGALLLQLNDEQTLWWAVRTVVLPQAGMNTLLGGVLYEVAWRHFNVERWMTAYRL